ncbi:MAG: hypothetical protein CMP11_01000 [Zetaproteobacteria bacterium]|nr:hypothetical protein [Pseudobdellovibrionaceae bacterium]
MKVLIFLSFFFLSFNMKLEGASFESGKLDTAAEKLAHQFTENLKLPPQVFFAKIKDQIDKNDPTRNPKNKIKAKLNCISKLIFLGYVSFSMGKYLLSHLILPYLEELAKEAVTHEQYMW